LLFGSDQSLGKLLSKRFDLGYIAIRRSLTNEIIAAGAAEAPLAGGAHFSYIRYVMQFGADASAIASKLVS
jgi:hypothetical protein